MIKATINSSTNFPEAKDNKEATINSSVSNTNQVPQPATSGGPSFNHQSTYKDLKSLYKYLKSVRVFAPKSVQIPKQTNLNLNDYTTKNK